MIIASCCLGEGQTDYPAYFKVLRESGYADGILEPHDAPYGSNSEVGSIFRLATLNAVLFRHRKPRVVQALTGFIIGGNDSMSITRMREKFSKAFKPVLVAIALVFLVGAFYQFGGGGSRDTEKAKTGGDVVAVVNKQDITRDEYTQAFTTAIKKTKDQYGEVGAMDMSRLKIGVLNDLIQRRTIMTAAEQQGIGVGYFELRRERNKMIEDEITALRKAIQGDKKKPLTDAAFVAALKNMRPSQTPASLRSELEKYYTDDVVRERVMARKLVDKIKSGVGSIDDNRLKDSYRKLQVQDIYIVPGGPKSKGMTDAQAKHKADEVLKSAKAGEDFAKLAEANSDFYSKDTKGISLMDASGDLDISKLKDGQVSDVLKSPMGGYRIAKVLSSKVVLPTDFDKNKKQYRDTLKTQLEQKALTDFMTKVQASVKVDVKDPELRGYYFADKAMPSMYSMSPTSPEEQKKNLDEAVSALQKATQQNGDPDAYVKLAVLYQMQDMNNNEIKAQNKNDRAIKILDDILNHQKIAEGSDLRLMLDSMLIQKGGKDGGEYKDQIKSDLDVVNQMSEIDQNPMIHQQILMMAKQMGVQKVVASEQQWLKDHPQQQNPMGMPVKWDAKSSAKPAAKPAK